MSRAPLLPLVLVLAGGCARGAAPDAQLAQLKRDLVRAYVERDAAELGRIYCDDFVVTDAKGVRRTKADELAHVGEARLSAGRYEPIAIRVFGDVAVLYGHGELEGQGDDGPFRASYDSFNVFVKREGRWCYAAAYTP
jgi:ketosteroid isomerase-like protein